VANPTDVSDPQGISRDITSIWTPMLPSERFPTFRITGFIDFVHRPALYKSENTMLRKPRLFRARGRGDTQLVPQKELTSIAPFA
jgi:hypothetical protein